jgi:hypothetical protein
VGIPGVCLSGQSAVIVALNYHTAWHRPRLCAAGGAMTDSANGETFSGAGGVGQGPPDAGAWGRASSATSGLRPGGSTPVAGQAGSLDSWAPTAQRPDGSGGMRTTQGRVSAHVVTIC